MAILLYLYYRAADKPTVVQALSGILRLSHKLRFGHTSQVWRTIRGRPCDDPHEHWWNEGLTGDREGRPYKKSSVRPPKPRLWDSLPFSDGSKKIVEICKKLLTFCQHFIPYRCLGF